MFGFSKDTECKKQLPKKAIYKKFNLPTAKQDIINKDISRIDIVSEISSITIPGIAEGKKIKDFYILALQLKKKDYSKQSIELLLEKIPQNIVLALQYGGQTQFAVHYTKLIISAWQATEETSLPLSGSNLDTIWENIVKSIGNIDVGDGNTLAEQISTDDQRAKLLARIATLERKMANERQQRRKREYFEQIKNLKNQI